MEQAAIAQAKSLAAKLNPSYKLLITMIVLFALALVHHPLQAVLSVVPPIVLMLTIGGLSLITLLKRLLPFAVFFFFYVFFQAAYSTTNDATVYHFLWYHFSKTGVINGIVLAFRMLTSVTYGVLFVSTTDLTDLIVSLCQDLRVPPKFAYGILAGIRFMPMFKEEWHKLRAARQLRGRDAKWSVTRIVTYALPLLSQAIRTSERVAVAMEARGFTNGPRTYYRQIHRGMRDVLYGLVLLAANLVIIIAF
ncbi:MAG: Monosaccharide-transporting ATPase [Bacilli bacterium]|nr:Monosaccharide-transporting ATPase [Bacilli bacterium]